ncbi:MAG TPA: helix-turn-helix domain-containing protein [Steroidobacteraceae bacterium]|nr:helix-turn-helix domain-containing protein [Steroidobacteraceae bacterium]
MTDLVVVVLGPIGTLELPADLYARYLRKPEAQKVEARAEPIYLSAKHVAERFDVPASWVYERARSGQLPSVRVGGRYVRFRVEDVDRCIGQSGAPGRPSSGHRQVADPQGKKSRCYQRATTRSGPQL